MKHIFADSLRRYRTNRLHWYQTTEANWSGAEALVAESLDQHSSTIDPGTLTDSELVSAISLGYVVRRDVAPERLRTLISSASFEEQGKFLEKFLSGAEHLNEDSATA